MMLDNRWTREDDERPIEQLCGIGRLVENNGRMEPMRLSVKLPWM
jgi:hypothetical protein